MTELVRLEADALRDVSRADQALLARVLRVLAAGETHERDRSRHPPLLLDGGLGTLLESRGNDVSSSLWSARVLRDDPDEVRAAHAEFADAGADVLISASYQVGFGGEIPDADVDMLLRRSVSLAREAGDGLVAASIGPVGALRADGSEYTGDYGLDLAQLRSLHRRRLAVLADAGADLLAVETIPAPLEVEALAVELADLGVPAFVSLSADSTGYAEAGALAGACGWRHPSRGSWRWGSTAAHPAASDRRSPPRPRFRSWPIPTRGSGGMPRPARGTAAPLRSPTRHRHGWRRERDWWAAAAVRPPRTSPRSPPRWGDRRRLSGGSPARGDRRRPPAGRSPPGSTRSRSASARPASARPRAWPSPRHCGHRPRGRRARARPRAIRPRAISAGRGRTRSRRDGRRR